MKCEHCGSTDHWTISCDGHVHPVQDLGTLCAYLRENPDRSIGYRKERRSFSGQRGEAGGFIFIDWDWYHEHRSEFSIEDYAAPGSVEHMLLEALNNRLVGKG